MADPELLTYLEEFVSPERRQRFWDVLKYRTKYLTIAAEDVFQMHNASAIVRSCDVFGIQELHLVEGRFGKRIDKNIAMGAQQWVDIKSYRSSEECMESLRANGYRIVATVPEERGLRLHEFKISHKTALFFGTEKEGLSAAVMEQADEFVQIPMVGFSESLNVSVSAAIMIYHLTTQLRESDLPWALERNEVDEKRLDWTKKSINNVEKIIERYKSGS